MSRPNYVEIEASRISDGETASFLDKLSFLFYVFKVIKSHFYK